MRVTVAYPVHELRAVFHGAILPSYGVGHSAAQWYIRDIPKVKQAFAQVWDTNELLVSFDGVTIWRPWTCLLYTSPSPRDS